MAKAKTAPDGVEEKDEAPAAAVRDQDRIDFNDPDLSGAEAVARNLVAPTNK